MFMEMHVKKHDTMLPCLYDGGVNMEAWRHLGRLRSIGPRRGK